MAKSNDWKKRDGVVYSTSSDFQFTYSQSETSATLPPNQQNLKILLDKSMRAGKQVTLVTGFIGTAEDLEKLGKMLKSKCGVGGSVKDSVILLQGDFRKRAAEILIGQGFKVSVG